MSPRCNNNKIGSENNFRSHRMRYLSTCSIAIAARQAAVVDVGDTVRVIRRTALKVDKQSVGIVPSGTAVKVEDINGDWLWGAHEGKQGWLAKREVTIQTPLLDTLIESEPANAGLYQMRGLTLLAQGQLDKAMESLRRRASGAQRRQRLHGSRRRLVSNEEIRSSDH
jgi:hypothetical protein